MLLNWLLAKVMLGEACLLAIDLLASNEEGWAVGLTIDGGLAVGGGLTSGESLVAGGLAEGLAVRAGLLAMEGGLAFEGGRAVGWFSC